MAYLKTHKDELISYGIKHLEIIYVFEAGSGEHIERQTVFASC